MQTPPSCMPASGTPVPPSDPPLPASIGPPPPPASGGSDASATDASLPPPPPDPASTPVDASDPPVPASGVPVGHTGQSNVPPHLSGSGPHAPGPYAPHSTGVHAGVASGVGSGGRPASKSSGGIVGTNTLKCVVSASTCDASRTFVRSG